MTILPGRRLTERDVTAAKALLADGCLTSKEVAARFGVSKARSTAISTKIRYSRIHFPVARI
ncbi:hypothetical protein IYY11_05445 [Methylocystis sp. H62]|uniref:hypothetical protein n=1 Tax=Methylocystis sp. H62 TaxID=2785789 RepID=UPI0018C3265A|nr:hypothetical protein [Methylocystis sp. H62]MBG0792848.1 hypothetical protein [Methylocystis sp. H62]